MGDIVVVREMIIKPVIVAMVLTGLIIKYEKVGTKVVENHLINISVNWSNYKV